jgi:hypothetical protein
LNGGGWWKPFTTIKPAVVVRRLVDAFNTRSAQHRQAAAEFCKFFSGQNWFGFRAACRGWILAGSLFVRHRALGILGTESRTASEFVSSFRLG